jgi:two-component system OmpR family sensor kinase
MTGLTARLSIRTRLTLWHSLVVFAVLIAAGASVLWLEFRLGLRRVDEELSAAGVAVSGVLRHELAEGPDLAGGVSGMMDELTLSGEAYAVVKSDGTILGTKTVDHPALTNAVLQSAGTMPFTHAAAPFGVRVRAVPFEYEGARHRLVVWKSLRPLQAERETLERAMLLGIPVAVLFSVLGGLGIARRSLGPLAVMAGQAEAISSHTLGARLLAPNPHDELGTLARAFNGLLDRLSASMQQQRAFMADASHQLRTPVSVIRTTAQVTLQRERRAEDEYRDSLDVVARQAQRLTKMVDDMFVLALADAEARPLQLAPLYLDELIEGVVDDFRLLAESRQVTLRSESIGEAPLDGDEHLLRQLLMNLIENAIRHTPAHGTVAVTLARGAGTLTIAVADTGDGIPATDVDHIFDRFVRFDTPEIDAGGGLGLPIARWIAEAHGGTLVLASTGPGGSRFLATLPTGKAGQGCSDTITPAPFGTSIGLA